MEMMPDKSLPPLPEDVQPSKILTPDDLVTATVRIKFVPKPGHPAIPDAIRTFNTVPMAQEFLKASQPSKQQLGSPKQAKAKRAKFLRVQPHILDNYNLEFSLEKKAPTHVQPTRPKPLDIGPESRQLPSLDIPGVVWHDPAGGIFGNGPGTADPTPVSDRPTGTDSGGRGPLDHALPSEAPPVHQTGREAEVSGEDPWSET